MQKYLILFLHILAFSISLAGVAYIGDKIFVDNRPIAGIPKKTDIKYHENYFDIKKDESFRKAIKKLMEDLDSGSTVKGADVIQKLGTSFQGPQASEGTLVYYYYTSCKAYIQQPVWLETPYIHYCEVDKVTFELADDYVANYSVFSAEIQGDSLEFVSITN